MAEILVVGATGKTGGRVSAQLAARGARVRAASRTLAPATAAIGMGVPADYAAHVRELFSLVPAGREDYLSPDVAQVLGRAPRSSGDWAESVRNAWLA